MTQKLTRRTAISVVGGAAVTGLAGCLGGDGDEDAQVLSSVDAGTEEWGRRLNEHAEQADIDWRQFEGAELTFGMGLHPYSTVTNQVTDAFTDLTGIEVTYEIFPEDEYWLEAAYDLENEGRYDGVMAGLWQAAEMHQNDWVYDLNEFIDDDSLTDRQWLRMDDFRDQTLELMTFPDDELVGFPNGIEAYGCVGYDEPTFELLGIDEPTTFEELEAAAQTISRSGETEREGIISRTSTTTLSSANWATMFRSHGAEWIDRDTKEARLNSPEGIESLERFGRMMRDYGPENPGQYDWYRANDALTEAETAMIYTTPSTSGAISESQIQQTKWIPPLPGPDGQDPTVATWVWATGISRRSDNPGAAWLFVQWANSRVGNYLLSTRQWDGHSPRAGTARLDFVENQIRGRGETVVGMPDDQPDWERIGITESFLEAHRQGMDQVPTSPPPVPVDTPQNMPIMTEAAIAMNKVVRGVTDAETALNEAAPQITEYAQEIPDLYLE